MCCFPWFFFGFHVVGMFLFRQSSHVRSFLTSLLPPELCNRITIQFHHRYPINSLLVLSSSLKFHKRKFYRSEFIIPPSTTVCSTGGQFSTATNATSKRYQCCRICKAIDKFGNKFYGHNRRIVSANPSPERDIYV